MVLGPRTDCDAAHHDAHCQRALLLEPDSYQGEARDVEQPRAETHADALREEHLPVRRAEAEHHDADHDEEVPGV